ncbi:hypothetical protein BH11PSE14_BH11PSE14_16410 [soil metagenome]
MSEGPTHGPAVDARATARLMDVLMGTVDE